MKMKDKKETDRVKRLAHKEEQRESAKARRQRAANLERRDSVQESLQRLLVCCEGKNTEPSYFRQFRRSNIQVKCFGEGRNTLSLVQRAISLRDDAATKGEPYDQVWCVFDRDPSTAVKGGHTSKNFNDAVWLATKEGIEVAYSIQAFEYWLILHFNDHQGGAVPRTDYDDLLNDYLKPHGCIYDGKGSKLVTKAIFDVLEAQDIQTGKRRRILAGERAERIFNQLPHTNPGSEESSTSVYQLVAILASE